MSSAGIRRTGQGGEQRGKQWRGASARILASTYCRITEGQREATGKTSRMRGRGGYRGTRWRREEVKRGEGRGKQERGTQ